MSPALWLLAAAVVFAAAMWLSVHVVPISDLDVLRSGAADASSGGSAMPARPTPAVPSSPQRRRSCTSPPDE
jgi:hypothetical protein